jgi:membrane protease subunit (stomatin/prohibitin family)
MARRLAQYTLLYRFPVKDQEIKNGAQLIVRETQAAVFVHEGQIADQFPPGRYTIDGGNTPILSEVRGMEVRLQFAVQSRGLLRQHQTVYRI